jgi:hypothetical protein
LLWIHRGILERSAGMSPQARQTTAPV